MQAMRLRTIFSRNLRAARQIAGLSQEKLAEEAGLDRSYISLLENERYSASLDAIEKIATVLKVEPQSLLERR